MRERIATANTIDLFQGSSNLLYVPAFTTMKESTIIDPTRSLGTITSTNSLTHSRKNTMHEPVSSLEDATSKHSIQRIELLIKILDHKQNSFTIKNPIG